MLVKLLPCLSAGQGGHVLKFPVRCEFLKKLTWNHRSPSPKWPPENFLGSKDGCHVDHITHRYGLALCTQMLKTFFICAYKGDGVSLIFPVAKQHTEEYIGQLAADLL